MTQAFTISVGYIYTIGKILSSFVFSINNGGRVRIFPSLLFLLVKMLVNFFFPSLLVKSFTIFKVQVVRWL